MQSFFEIMIGVFTVINSLVAGMANHYAHTAQFWARKAHESEASARGTLRKIEGASEFYILLRDVQLKNDSKEDGKTDV